MTFETQSLEGACLSEIKSLGAKFFCSKCVFYHSEQLSFFQQLSAGKSPAYFASICKNIEYRYVIKGQISL